MKFNENGILSEVNSTGNTMTENLGYEGVRAKLTKDINSRYFLTFQTEVAKEDDQNTISMFIQDFFHDATKSWDNAQGGKQVQYDYIDHMDARMIVTGEVGLGRHFILFENSVVKLSNKSEIGYRLSSEEEFSGAFIKSSFNLEVKGSKFSLYGEYDTKDNYVYGAKFEQRLYQSDRYRLSMSVGVSKEDKYYNDLYIDLKDHRTDAQRVSGNDLLYQYTLKLSFY